MGFDESEKEKDKNENEIIKNSARGEGREKSLKLSIVPPFLKNMHITHTHTRRSTAPW
jgi:hypothetical protein